MRTQSRVEEEKLMTQNEILEPWLDLSPQDLDLLRRMTPIVSALLRFKDRLKKMDLDNLPDEETIDHALWAIGSAQWVAPENQKRLDRLVLEFIGAGSKTLTEIERGLVHDAEATTHKIRKCLMENTRAGLITSEGGRQCKYRLTVAAKRVLNVPLVAADLLADAELNIDALRQATGDDKLTCEDFIAMNTAIREKMVKAARHEDKDKFDRVLSILLKQLYHEQAAKKAAYEASIIQQVQP